MNINVIGAPIKYGCDRDGVQLGPDRLRELGVIDIIKNNGFNVFDMGNLYIPDILEECKYDWHESAKYFGPIKDFNINLAHSVYSSLKSRSFPFVLGGDHSLGMGSIAGASKYFKEIAVIWVDAHGDINDIDSSPSGNVHGMPLAASMNVGHESLTNLYYEGIKVKPENVYIIGARNLDPGEERLAKKLNLNLYTQDDINSLGLENILKETISKIKSSNVNGVHLSFDIDVLDAEISPGTGVAEENGINVEEAKIILDKILSEKFVTSMDFVEFNPKLDVDDKTAKICLDLLEFIFKKLN
ncbi:MAG TPA: arginase [Tissierellaceae bacterium]|nr:arginase [Tissierellaceae bacterium]